MIQKVLTLLHLAATHHGAIILAVVATAVITVLFLRSRTCPSCGGRKFIREKTTDFPVMVNKQLATDTIKLRCVNSACGHVLETMSNTRQPTKIELLGLSKR